MTTEERLAAAERTIETLTKERHGALSERDAAVAERRAMEEALRGSSTGRK